MTKKEKLQDAAERYKALKQQIDQLETQIKPVKQMLVAAAKVANLDTLDLGNGVSVIRKQSNRFCINPDKITPAWLCAIHDGGLFDVLSISVNKDEAARITQIEKECFFDEVELTEKQSVTYAVIS